MKINLLFRVRAGYIPLALLQMLLLFWVATGSAQNVSVTGTVSDAQGFLPGVNVKIKNKLVAATTDASGVFQITALPEDMLVFSYIGYVSVEVGVGSQTNFTILLKADETALDEVLVNAGYYKVKDKERTGSIAKITAKEIEGQPVSNVLATMQGRMAGVNVTQDAGTPGGGFQIKIRGLNSLRADGNAPLYIVDGVPYSSESIGYSNTNSGFASPTSPLNSLNPNNIESIEVLKDADATAIYGSRGANGVVLITTKKGKAGKTQFNLTSSTGIGKVTKFIDLMNTEQYLAMRKAGFENDGITEYPATAYDVNGTWDENRNTDWQKELIGGTAEINDVQLNVSGGSAQTQYMLGGTRRTETTVLPGNFAYNRTAVNFSMHHNSDDNKFKLSFSGGYAVQDNKQPSTDLTKTARTLAPNAPALYDENGALNWENNTFQNPLGALGSLNTRKTDDLVANAVLTYSILPNLDFKTNLGFTNLKNHEQRTIPSTIVNPALNITSASSSLFNNVTERKSLLFEPQLEWKKTYGNNKLSVLVGATAQTQTTARLYSYGAGFSSNVLITNMASASLQQVTASDVLEYKYQAFFGRINYNYDGQYLLNLTGRRDGSSRFGPGKQFATFGAVGAAWVFSNAGFLKDNKVVSFGKIRASYGTSGNDQIGDYQFLNTYSGTSLNYEGVVGLEPTRLYNPEFGWESITKLEVALETGFLKDRISTTLAWYRNRSSNQLVGIPLPGTTGFSSITANLDATVENSGIEATLHTVNFDKGAFKWSSNFNIAVAKNKLISFPGLAGSTYSNKYVIGESVSIVKLYDYLGVNAQTGLYEVADVNGDGVFNAIGDKQTTVDLSPDYFGGLQNQLQYKNWHLDFMFQFVKQQTYAYTPNVPGGYFFNQSTATADVWQEAGDVATYQALTSGGNGDAVNAFYRYAESTASIVDGSFIRLKNIALSFTLPPLSKAMSCKLFLQGQNVLTFTSYKGGDPEFRQTGYLPPLRVYTAGVQLTF